MKSYILFILSLITIVYDTRVYSQTNLICNPSFEEVDQEAFDRLNDADNWHASHVYEWGNSTSVNALFSCWMRDIDHAQATPGSPTGGIQYGIVPGLFPTFDGSTYNFYGYPGEGYVTDDGEGNVRVFVEENGGSGLSLAANQQGLHGLDLSPPNTKFGENVYATHGNNYVALFDLENDEWDCVPSLFTELKYALQKDVTYTFSMDFCKMNLLGYLKDTEGWDDVKDGKIEVYISYDEAPFSPRQKICEIDADDNAWDVTTWEFDAERSYTHLLIEFDPIKGGPVLIHDKIAGVFIDNLKLYETCETADNQCQNANYKRDLLDAKLEEAELQSPIPFPQSGWGTMKTIRAYHLENVKRLEMKIYKGTVLVRTIDHWYPESDYFWDGKNDAGNLMPDDNDYKAIINAVSNDCFHKTHPDENNFELRHNYDILPAFVGQLSVDANGSIGSLENVHDINVRISMNSGQQLYNFNIHNPRPVIAFSIESLAALPGNQVIVEGSYLIQATVSNNCGEMEIESYEHIGHKIPDGGPQYEQYYDYASVPKGDFPCPFDFHYNQYVRSPMNCCEGYLHLENMEIWNSWGEVNIQDSILIGPNVVFGPGTYNYLNAGEQIVLIPDSTGVVISGEAVLTPNTFHCEICKSYTIVSSDQYAGDAVDFTTTIHQRDSLEATAEMILFPNPAAKDQELTLRAGSDPINPTRYRLVLSNSLGVEVPVKVTKATERMIQFKPASAIASGVYYLYYESNGMQQTFSLVIR